MSSHITIKVNDGPADLERVLNAIEELGEKEGWDPGVVFKINLALEELGLNVMSHGYHPDLQDIQVTLSSSPDAITVEISDNGLPFDPLSDAPEPDLSSPVEDRPIGGLGVHLVRELMSSMSYRREHGRNYLCLVASRSD